MGWELLGFLGVGGLDKGICWEIRGKNLRSPRRGLPRRNPGAQRRGTWGTRHLGHPRVAAPKPRCPNARHLGHPDSVVVITSPGTWGTRHLGHPRVAAPKPRCPKARHLGHPDSVVVITSPGTWGTRHLGHPRVAAPKPRCPNARHLGHPASARVIRQIPRAASRRPDCARWYYSPGFPKQLKSMPRQQKEIA